MGGVTFECVSAPSTVTLGQKFDVVLKTNLKSAPGHAVECVRKDIGHGYLRGEDYPPYDNGTFTFSQLYYKQGKPPKIVYGFPSTFSINFGLFVNGAEVATLIVNVTVTG